MYKVINYFVDLQDNNFEYKEKDVYPRKGYTPSKERIAELESKNNKQNKPLIKKVAEKKKANAEKKPAEK